MAKKTILIMEGDEAFAMMLSNTLEVNKYRVVTSNDGQRAGDLIKKEAPNLILLCLELPNVSGYLVCKELKEDKDLRKIPLIIMSSQAKQEDFDKHRKLKVRAEDYLIKPFTDEDLLQKVENLIGFHINEEEYSALQEQIAHVLEEKTAVDGKLRDKEEELASVRERSKSAAKEVDLLTEKLEASARKLKDATARLKRAEDRIGEQQERLMQCEDRMRKIEAERKRLDEEKRKLKELIGKAANVLEEGR